MAANPIPQVAEGSEMTAEAVNAARRALSGDLIPRDPSGVAVDGESDCGSENYRWRTIYAKGIDLDGRGIRAADDLVFWNGVLSGEGAIASAPGAEAFLTIGADDRTVTIAVGTRVAALGREKVVGANVVLPAPVGSSPVGDQFDIRRVGWRGGLFSYNRQGVHSAFAPRVEAGSEVHEYGIFYDASVVAGDKVVVAPLAGVFATPAEAPLGAVTSDHDRILSAADNRIYRRSGSAWVGTGEAWIGCVAYDAVGDVSSVFCCRSRRFLEVVSSVPMADYVRFADGRAANALRWASTLHSNYFGVQAALDFPAMSAFFRDPVGGSLTALAGGVAQDNFIGAAASPAEAKPRVLTNADAAADGIFLYRVSSGGGVGVIIYLDYPRQGIKSPGAKISGLYVGDGIAGWGRDADERTLLELLERPDPVAGMHPYMPARAVSYAFRFDTKKSVQDTNFSGQVSDADAFQPRPFSAGLKLNQPLLPDGSLDASGSGGQFGIGNLAKARINNSATFNNSVSSHSPWVLLRRPDHLLGRDGERLFLPPALPSSTEGDGVTALPHRFGIARAALT